MYDLTTDVRPHYHSNSLARAPMAQGRVRMALGPMADQRTAEERHRRELIGWWYRPRRGVNEFDAEPLGASEDFESDRRGT